MITILTTTKNQFLKDSINTVDRLNELVRVGNFDLEITHHTFQIENDTIIPSIDWNDTEIPYLFPVLPLNQNNLLTYIFYKLGNYQKAFEFISEKDEIYLHLLIATNLQFGYAISSEQIIFLKQSSAHNLAVVSNFGNLETPLKKEKLQELYKIAIKNGKTNHEKLYSAKQYANLLMDEGLPKEAEELIRSIKEKVVTKEEKNALNTLLANSIMAQIKLPYQQEMLNEVAFLQKECIAFFENNNLKVNAGLLLINASEIANFQDKYIKSKDLINKAILYFKEENIPEFLAEATLQKAILLYTWSKNGSPQYYKPAINTFQNALKVFKRDTHPQKFADIHHNLALIYSEIQVSDKEKPIWTAFCASSFKEALQFYTKEQFPYQYAMISHNYATALMGFPEAKLHNNLDKAFGLFEEALSIRTAEKYPFERALTVLNQLELYWLIHNYDEIDERKKHNEMVIKTNEIFNLVDEDVLIEKAINHLEELKNLKTIID